MPPRKQSSSAPASSGPPRVQLGAAMPFAAPASPGFFPPAFHLAPNQFPYAHQIPPGWQNSAPSHNLAQQLPKPQQAQPSCGQSKGAGGKTQAVQGETSQIALSGGHAPKEKQAKSAASLIAAPALPSTRPVIPTPTLPQPSASPQPAKPKSKMDELREMMAMRKGFEEESRRRRQETQSENCANTKAEPKTRSCDPSHVNTGALTTKSQAIRNSDDSSSPRHSNILTASNGVGAASGARKPGPTGAAASENEKRTPSGVPPNAAAVAPKQGAVTVSSAGNGADQIHSSTVVRTEAQKKSPASNFHPSTAWKEPAGPKPTQSPASTGSALAPAPWGGVVVSATAARKIPASSATMPKSTAGMTPAVNPSRASGAQNPVVNPGPVAAGCGAQPPPPHHAVPTPRQTAPPEAVKTAVPAPFVPAAVPSVGDVAAPPTQLTDGCLSTTSLATQPRAPDPAPSAAKTEAKLQSAPGAAACSEKPTAVEAAASGEGTTLPDQEAAAPSSSADLAATTVLSSCGAMQGGVSPAMPATTPLTIQPASQVPCGQETPCADTKPLPPVQPSSLEILGQIAATLQPAVCVAGACSTMASLGGQLHAAQHHDLLQLHYQRELQLLNQQAAATVKVEEAARAEAKRREEKAQEIAELAMDEEVGAAYDEQRSQTFQAYAPARLRGIGVLRAHPDAVTETSTLGSVAPPAIRYRLRLPRKTILEGRLTDLQIESVLYACAQHETFLPDSNVRAGFFSGDGRDASQGAGTGVGKGRQVAGLVFENYLRGRKKAVWISTTHDLAEDARRDLRDIGAGAIEVHDLRDPEISGRLPCLTSGVLFASYALLVREERLEQILRWCGRDFDGVLALDEAHKARNHTKSAAAVIHLQDRLPSARVMYVSATGASEPGHLVYARRLGLWGPGTPFATPELFESEIQSGGIGAMELLAMQLKHAGKYLARSLSFRGAELQIETAHLDAAFVRKYNASVELWAELKDAVFDAIRNPRLAAADAGRRKLVMTQYWGAHLRFWMLMCMAAKVQPAVRLAREALAAGRCVVIGLQTTGEAALEASHPDEALCSTANSIFRNFVRDWSLLPKPDQDELCGRSRALQLPMNPLDDLLAALGGPAQVAEMTGRSKRQVLRDGVWTTVQRCRGAAEAESVNVKERRRFMAGRKLVAIISDAASTGISLQADRRVPNQRKRVHITLQLPWSADKAVQQMGRSHRSNQAHPPDFVLLMSPEIGGERRFASAVAARLQQLGALTRGDRMATGACGRNGESIQSFAIHPLYGKLALQRLLESIFSGKPTAELPDFLQAEDFASFADRARVAMDRAGLTDTKTRQVTTRTFMNRLLGMRLDIQDQIYSFWQTIMGAMIREAKQQGKYQEGIVDIAAETITVEEEAVLSTRLGDGAETRYVRISGDRGVRWEKAAELAGRQTDDRAGFYALLNDSSPYNILLALEKKGQIRNSRWTSFSVVRPNTGFRPDELSSGELRRQYRKLDNADAERLWNRLFDLSHSRCGHRAGSEVCRGEGCTFKKRLTHYHILTGAVIPCWQLIKALVGKKQGVKVVRVETSCGRRLVGALIASDCIDKVKQSIAQGVKPSDAVKQEVSKEGQLKARTKTPKFAMGAGKGKRRLGKMQMALPEFSDDDSDSDEDLGLPAKLGAAGSASNDILVDSGEVEALKSSEIWEEDQGAEAMFEKGHRICSKVAELEIRVIEEEEDDEDVDDAPLDEQEHVEVKEEGGGVKEDAGGVQVEGLEREHGGDAAPHPQDRDAALSEGGGGLLREEEGGSDESDDETPILQRPEKCVDTRERMQVETSGEAAQGPLAGGSPQSTQESGAAVPQHRGAAEHCARLPVPAAGPSTSANLQVAAAAAALAEAPAADRSGESWVPAATRMPDRQGMSAQPVPKAEARSSAAPLQPRPSEPACGVDDAPRKTQPASGEPRSCVVTGNGSAATSCTAVPAPSLPETPQCSSQSVDSAVPPSPSGGKLLCFPMPFKAPDPRDPKHQVKVVFTMRRPEKAPPGDQPPSPQNSAAGPGGERTDSSPLTRSAQTSGSDTRSEAGPAHNSCSRAQVKTEGAEPDAGDLAALAEVHTMRADQAKQHVLKYAFARNLMDWEGAVCYIRIDAALKQILGSSERLRATDLEDRLRLFLQIFSTPHPAADAGGRAQAQHTPSRTPTEELPCGRRLGFNAGEVSPAEQAPGVGEEPWGDASPCLAAAADASTRMAPREEAELRPRAEEGDEGERAGGWEKERGRERDVAAELLCEEATLTLQTAARGRAARRRLSERKLARAAAAAAREAPNAGGLKSCSDAVMPPPPSASTAGDAMGGRSAEGVRATELGGGTAPQMATLMFRGDGSLVQGNLRAKYELDGRRCRDYVVGRVRPAPGAEEEGVQFLAVQSLEQKGIVSSRHARLSYCAASRRWSIRDLNSQNGTFVNQVMIGGSRPTILSDHDKITFGCLNKMSSGIHEGATLHPDNDVSIFKFEFVSSAHCAEMEDSGPSRSSGGAKRRREEALPAHEPAKAHRTSGGERSSGGGGGGGGAERKPSAGLKRGGADAATAPARFAQRAPKMAKAAANPFDYD